MKPKVYIAGSIFETDYRDYCHKYYGDKIEILDPIKENGVEVDKQNNVINRPVSNKEIVEKDKELIFQSDYVVAYIHKLSIGTLMECMLAFDNNIKLYLITHPASNFEKDVWLGYHIDRYFWTIDSCLDTILLEWNK